MWLHRPAPCLSVFLCKMQTEEHLRAAKRIRSDDHKAPPLARTVLWDVGRKAGEARGEECVACGLPPRPVPLPAAPVPAPGISGPALGNTRSGPTCPPLSPAQSCVPPTPLPLLHHHLLSLISLLKGVPALPPLNLPDRLCHLCPFPHLYSLAGKDRRKGQGWALGNQAATPRRQGCCEVGKDWERVWKPGIGTRETIGEGYLVKVTFKCGPEKQGVN